MTAVRRLFVVAAHPDDDTIGCGGLMASVAATGGAAHVAYLTDGGMSHPRSMRYPPHVVACMREAEARAALRALGVADVPEFFALPDSALDRIAAPAAVATVDRLAESIIAFAPDVVLAPWCRDPHPDHRAASSLARAACRRAGRPIPFAGYDVWLSIRGGHEDFPAPGEAVVETYALSGDARARKRRALFCHRSQTTDLIDDDPSGFRITSDLAERWLGPDERFFVSNG